MKPTLVRHSLGLITYSPSSGNVSRMSMPPRVPSGNPVDVPGLREIEPDAMRLVGRRAGRIADRHGADRLGGGDVAFEQHRGYAEHVGHVVEAEARVVRRQQRRGVNVERQQVANRVLVFGAVQPVQRRATGIGAGGRRAIDGRLEPCDERRARRRRLAAACPGAASRPPAPS